MGTQGALWITGSHVIEALGPRPESPAHQLIDADLQTVSIGLFDTHTHGALGYGVGADRTQMVNLLEALEARGQFDTQLSTVALPSEEIKNILATARLVKQEKPSLRGIHLEGPFIGRERKGAHSGDHLRDGTMANVQGLLSDYLDTVTSLTLDPLCVDPEVIQWCVNAGIRVAIGHTEATYDQAREAFDRGATILTHAFNAMAGVSAREPGPVMAALESGAWIEIIADGHHVHPSLVRWLFSVAPERVVLVTDSMPASGLGDGSYHLGDLEVSVSAGVARLPAGSLAGSTLFLAQAVQNCVAWGVTPDHALRAATENPRKAYGLPIPEIAVGTEADLVVWSQEMALTHVLRKGRLLPAP